jgi:hypothetical protein
MSAVMMPSGISAAVAVRARSSIRSRYSAPAAAEAEAGSRTLWFGARSALLPMRSGLPAALEGRKLDRQRPASGKCRRILPKSDARPVYYGGIRADKIGF